ncbi:MAG TPA: hypothetical protein VNB22_16330 [Pyrinomonadaceae bacterium]|nr:hypothetical protein [Pyrinomonadaceae bacterium]
MKILFRFALLSAFFLFLFAKAEAIPVNIVSGELFIGGTSYNTPDYQTYLRFYLVGQTRVPKRNYIMSVEQADAVYLNHPVQPSGDYEYRVGMPYHGSSFTVNDELFFPVWYSACVWKIQSSALTPEATANSPQFMTVNAPFTMNGSSNFYGAYSTGFRLKGQGTSELKFEKIGGKYFLLQARYTFTSNTSLNQNSK